MPAGQPAVAPPIVDRPAAQPLRRRLLPLQLSLQRPRSLDQRSTAHLLRQSAVLRRTDRPSPQPCCTARRLCRLPDLPCATLR